MALAILELLNGDTNYVSKHNANYSNIKAAVEALQAAIGSSGPGGGAPESTAISYEALFGNANAVIGVGSYLPSDSPTSHELKIAPGYAYVEAQDAVVTRTTEATLNFLGQTTGTYYIHVDSTGLPYYDAVPSGALYSVYYNQSDGNFSSVSVVGKLFEAADDHGRTRTNLWEIQYPSIDGRIDGVEKAVFYVLRKTIGSADITLSLEEAYEQGVIILSGAPQTQNVSLTLPAAEKVYTVVNDCDAGYSVEIGTGLGSGYALAGGYFAILHCNGADVTPLFLLDRSSGASPVSSFLSMSDTPGSFTGFGTWFVRVNSAGNALEFYQNPGYLTQLAADALYSAVGHTHEFDSGDVVGPESAVSDAIALFDGLSGKLIKDSGKTLAQLAVFYPSSFYQESPTASQLMLHIVFVEAVQFPAGLTSSQAYADTAPEAQTDFDLQKNGVSIGTIRFAAASNTASFLMASAQSFAPGDRLKVIAPSVPDALLAGVTFALAGTRTLN
jgi:hypothetical protein